MQWVKHAQYNTPELWLWLCACAYVYELFVYRFRAATAVFVGAMVLGRGAEYRINDEA